MKSTDSNEKRDLSSFDKEDDEDNNFEIRRTGPIEMLDDFIIQVLSIRRTLFSVSLCAILLAPVSIGLCIYMFLHPSFLKVLDDKDDFGEILTVLLLSVIGVSTTWLVVGIKQHKSISSWNKKYEEYQQAQLQMHKRIKEEFGLFRD